MLEMIARMFQGIDYKELIAKGAVIVDVRSPAEYRTGSIRGSKNIPLNTITKKALEIKKWEKKVVLCCASGMRSGQATSILKNHGVEAHNGGGWSSLQYKIK
jgi:rhodanese-related sulfurtransferase